MKSFAQISIVSSLFAFLLFSLPNPKVNAQVGLEEPTAEAQHQPADEPAESASKTGDKEEVENEKEEQEKAKESDSKPVELNGVFEAVQAVTVQVDLEKWSELKVIEAAAHGSTVTRGDVLIRLETEALEKAIHEAELGLKLERLSLAEAELQNELLERNHRLSLKAAQDADRTATEDLKEFLTRGRDERVASARQSEKSSRNRLAYEEEELHQLEKMYEADDLTEETEEIILKRTRDSVDAARYSLKVVLSSARRSLEFLIPRSEDGLKDAVKKAALALEETEATLPIERKKQELQLQKQRDALQQKEEDLAQLRADLAKMVVKASRPGVVYYGESKRGKWSDPSAIEAMLRPGGTLKQKATVMSIVQMQPLRLRVAVPEASLRYFEVGAKATVHAIAFPDTGLSATVQEVSAIPVADGTFDAILKVNRKELQDRIVPGMKAKVKMNAAAE